MGAFITMEGVIWHTHKYVMHGAFWNLHIDHQKNDDPIFFEINDYFFLIFVISSIVALSFGTLYSNEVLLSIGIGITIYGGTYFFIHQRFEILKNSDNWH